MIRRWIQVQSYPSDVFSSDAYNVAMMDWVKANCE